MIDGILIENDTRTQFIRMHDFLDRYNKIAPIGSSISVENEMVKYPARYIQYCISFKKISGFYFDGSTKDWEVIDGNKRLRTILNFIDNQFPLENGQYFHELRGYLRDILKSSLLLDCILINPGAPDKEIIKKYLREIE